MHCTRLINRFLRILLACLCCLITGRAHANGDGIVDSADLGILLLLWGECIHID